MNGRVLIAVVGLASALTFGACASSQGGRAPEPDTPAIASPQTMQEMYEAGHYAGAVRKFLADPALATDESALFRAAVASAMPGHRESNNIRALDLFTRLLVEFPDSDRRTTVRLVLGMLEEEAALRRSNSRLERELEQLKAIDLGDGP